MSYDYVVVRLAKTMVDKLLNKTMSPGWGWDDKAHMRLPDLTADQQHQLWELMLFSGYEGGFYPSFDDDDLHFLVRGTTDNPMKYRGHRLFQKTNRTADDAISCVYSFIRKDMFHLLDRIPENTDVQRCSFPKRIDFKTDGDYVKELRECLLIVLEDIKQNTPIDPNDVFPFMPKGFGSSPTENLEDDDLYV